MDSGAQRFLARNIIRFQAGWECIEVFPFFELDRWKPEFALMWAENDLLATIVTRQFQESRLQSLDPNAAARKHFARVLNSFKALLDSDPDREETIQVFLRENPVLLSPTYTRLWPKVPLGACVTDFIFQEAAGDYTLVEIERSTYHLFIQDGDTSRHLNHARNQVQDWKRYLEDNLSTVQRELGLAEISANPKSLIIIGRSNQMSPENRRKLVTIENESPKVKILTYDDVYANAKAVMENLLGPIWDTVGDTQIFYLPANHPGMPG
jgi:hypothetical protein